MKLAIMQPYFLPYIGYFQLIAAADIFIVYDNIKYTKKGWINRNRMLRNGEDVTFSVPLKSDSDSLDVGQRQVAPDFDRAKLLNQIRGAYMKAPHFDIAFPLITRILNHDDANLFGYILNSIELVCSHVGIETPLVISSSIGIDHALKAEEKVLALCSATGADTYINAIGGIELYDRETFAAENIDLKFIKSDLIEYPQFGQTFVPWLSMLDVMMFNSAETIREQMLGRYHLV